MARPAIDLRFGDLALAFDLAARDIEPPGGRHHDWLRLTVRAAVPSFRAEFPWSVMPDELRQLAGALDALALAEPGSRPVRFRPVQPLVMLGFALITRGTVTGSYHFRPDYTRNCTLQGSFTLDQRGLPEAAERLRTFLRAIDAELPAA